MSPIFKTTLLSCLIFCIFSVLSFAQAQISPDVMKMLRVAAKKDNGVHLNMVADIAIAANPRAAKDIRDIVARLKAQKSVVSEARPPKENNPVKITVKKKTQDFDFFSFQGWDSELELNYLRSSGNTRQESLGIGGKMKRNTQNFHHILSSFFDLNKNNDATDKQRWGISYKLDYDFSKKLYMTSLLGYENDQFGTFRERITSSLGLGYPLIRHEQFSWKLEAGPSILFTKDFAGARYNRSFNAFASSLFEWTINDHSAFNNVTIVYFGNKNVIESKSALKVKINGDLSSKFSYDILYDADAPLGRKKYDSVARAGLLYDF